MRFNFLSSLFFALTVAIALCLSSANAFAQDDQAKYRKRGTLSSSIRGSEGTAVDGPWGGANLSGEGTPPISGSVSRSGDDWIARVVNTSPDRYSVRLEVVQNDKDNRVLKRDFLSYTLSAGEDREKKIRGRSNTISAALKITNWKNLSPKKEEEAGSSDAAAKVNSSTSAKSAYPKIDMGRPSRDLP